MYRTTAACAPDMLRHRGELGPQELIDLLNRYVHGGTAVGARCQDVPRRSG
jgi:hypothetical protein